MSATGPIKLKVELDFSDEKLVEGLRALIREEVERIQRAQIDRMISSLSLRAD